MIGLTYSGSSFWNLQFIWLLLMLVNFVDVLNLVWSNYFYTICVEILLQSLPLAFQQTFDEISLRFWFETF